MTSKNWCMHFIRSSRNNFRWITTTLKNYRIFPSPSEGIHLVLHVLKSFCFFQVFSVGNFISMYRLIITDNAQCGDSNTWCALNKKSRNARTRHSQNPSYSDAVQFFIYVFFTDVCAEFNIKASFYSRFEQLLGTPVKPL